MWRVDTRNRAILGYGLETIKIGTNIEIHLLRKTAGIGVTTVLDRYSKLLIRPDPMIAFLCTVMFRLNTYST
jgi:hypothetical protein